MDLGKLQDLSEKEFSVISGFCSKAARPAGSQLHPKLLASVSRMGTQGRGPARHASWVITLPSRTGRAFTGRCVSLALLQSTF